MNAVRAQYIPFFFSRKSVLTFSSILVVTFLMFIARPLTISSILFNIVEVVLFFYLSSKLSKKWANVSVSLFSKRLFRVAFLIRLIWILFSYLYYNALTGKPFEFEAADSFGYHNEAVWLVGLLKDSKFDVYLAYIGTNYSDMGYPFYLGIFYYLLGDGVLIPRILKAILSSYTCLLVYYIARNNFNESTGRMAGIMAMLVPNLIYYCGIHVKETEMVFLTVWFVYLADQFIRSPKVYLSSIVGIVLVGASVFFFRTVLAACLIGSVGVATFLTSSRISKGYKRVVLGFLLIAGVFFIYSTPLGKTIDEYLAASDENLTSQMKNYATREGGGENRLARYGSRSIFLPMMLIAPFPTLVYIPEQPNAMMLGGALFTRNVYAFFVLIGLGTLFKRKKLRAHILLLAITFSYIFVLASSGFALSERFHLPLVPFLLILAAYGISQMNRSNKKYFVPYLMLISIIIIGWNWFKVAGRS
ncbi:hypothetical protein ACFPMF_27400 [Larkinella bovis]|uniref:Glycosyltransferase RgtA/B/C/D-like domain-containing protein n=1 Tax=Larkinella bovis TaxID=683041 RepID=A0ABW0IHS9_9BACT